MKKEFSNLLVVLLLIITLTSVESWSTISLAPSLTIFLIRTFIFVIPFIWAYKLFRNPLDKSRGWALTFFLAWIIITGARSVFIARGKDQWTFLLMYLPAMLSIITVYYFDHLYLFKKLNYYWFRFAPLLCLIWFPFMSSAAIGFFLPLLLLYLLFISIIPNKSKWILLIFTFFIIFICYKSGARSHVLKFGVALLLGLSLYFKSLPFYLKAIKFGRISLLFAPIILFILAITNIFNVFKMDEYISGDYSIQTLDADGNEAESSLVADTRTFLYEEAIISAIKNNYVIMGRSFARGYDSYFQVGRSERAGRVVNTDTVDRISEVAIINIFTWMGVVGVILYFFIFVKATELAIYNSNNVYIKIVGLYVSFRWCYGWVEDFQRLDISTLTLWMLLALCFSKTFRKFNDHEFSTYIKSIFIK
jgi:hypothetical protein